MRDQRPNEKLHLGAFFHPTGHHVAAWLSPDSQIDAGISEGEVVAVSGLERLEDGKKVRLLEIQEAEV